MGIVPTEMEASKEYYPTRWQVSSSLRSLISKRTFELTEDQVRLEEPANFAGTLSSLQNLDKEFSFTNQFHVEKSQEDEPKRTNTALEV
ncbi:hypothetical protein Tco_0065140 [Tanacetum coccineum]